MNQEILEKHEALVVELGRFYLENMALELGKKYKNNKHELNIVLTDNEYTELKSKYDISNDDYTELYSEFLKMEPTQHLKQVIDAFTASGGNIDMEPLYDEQTGKLNVTVSFAIKETTLDKIEGLSPIEEYFIKMNAMIQVESILANSDPDVTPAF